jgi:hypothetical protein
MEDEDAMRNFMASLNRKEQREYRGVKMIRFKKKHPQEKDKNDRKK